MLRTIFLLSIVISSACTTAYHQDHKVKLHPNPSPLDIREAILISLPQGLSYSESELITTNIQQQLKSNGFIEAYTSEELEVELLSAGITDFSIQRNVDRLYSELGIVYLLQVDILNRRKAGRGKLSQLSAANREFERNQVNFYHYPENLHLVDIQYSLFQTDIADTLAVYRVHAAHKWDNTFRPKIIRSDIQRLIDFLNLGVTY
jgi:hypothetical protein